MITYGGALNYYRRYIGDYLRDTSRLSVLEHGAYNLMLDYYYADERALPLDVAELCLMIRAVTVEDRMAVEKVLGTFFTKGEDGWHQGRVDHELEISKHVRDAQRQSGVQAAAKRWGKPLCGQCKRSDPHEHEHGLTDGLTDKSTNVFTHRSAIQPPTTNRQPPTTNHQPPTTSRKPTKVKTVTRAGPRAQGNGSATWEAYAEAYQGRYGVPPVRNAKVNAQLEQFTHRLPEGVAPEIARFYLTHNYGLYIGRGHSVGVMLIDAEKLHMEWARGSKVTRLETRTAEKEDSMREQSVRVGKILGESDA